MVVVLSRDKASGRSLDSFGKSLRGRRTRYWCHLWPRQGALRLICPAPWHSCLDPVDIRPIRDVAPLMGNPQQFQILKMDRSRGNIVVSRRAVLEETRAEERSELMSNLSEGQVLEGVVKNITDYGAFVDLGGVDGLPVCHGHCSAYQPSVRGVAGWPNNKCAGGPF